MASATESSVWVPERVEAAGYLTIAQDDIATSNQLKERWLVLIRRPIGYRLDGFLLLERRAHSVPIESIKVGDSLLL